MINAIIVDDEINCVDVLRVMLNTSCPYVKIIGTAHDVDEAYELISTKKPDLVYLDIELISGTAFDLLQKFKEITFDIIFTTAYNHYALKAIKFNCLQYILKPIDREELVEATKRYKDKSTSNFDKEINSLFENFMKSQSTSSTRIALPTIDGFEFIEINEITKLEADGVYTWIYIIGKEKPIICTKILKHFDELLSDLQFVRVHRKYIININHIKKYYKGDGGYVVLEDGNKVEISRRRKDDFLNSLNKL